MKPPLPIPKAQRSTKLTAQALDAAETNLWTEVTMIFMSEYTDPSLLRLVTISPSLTNVTWQSLTTGSPYTLSIDAFINWGTHLNQLTISDLAFVASNPNGIIKVGGSPSLAFARLQFTGYDQLCTSCTLFEAQLTNAVVAFDHIHFRDGQSQQMSLTLSQSSLSMTNITFENGNRTAGVGSALEVVATDTPITISDLQVMNMNAFKASVHITLSGEGNMTLDGGLFQNNVGQRLAAGIYLTADSTHVGSITLKHVEMDGQVMTTDVGGSVHVELVSDQSHLVLDSWQVHDGQTQHGGLYLGLQQATLDIQHMLIHDNTATQYAAGLQVVGGSTVTLYNITVHSQTCIGEGCGIHYLNTLSDSQTTMQLIRMSGISSTIGGAVLKTQVTNGTLTWTDVEVSSSQSTGGSCVFLYLTNTTATLNQVNVSYNAGYGNGNLQMAMFSSEVTFKNMYIGHNVQPVVYGAGMNLYINASHVQLLDSLVELNQGIDCAGGMFSFLSFD